MSEWSADSQRRATLRRGLFRRLAYGPRGEHQQAWTTYLGRDPLMRDVSMVVDLSYGGGERVVLAAAPVLAALAEPSGSSTVARVGAVQLLLEEPQIELSYTLGSGSSSTRSLSCTIGNLRVDPWSLVLGRGTPLAGHGEVSLIAPGMDWGARLVLMRGDMTGGVSFGAARQGMDVTLSDPKLTADLGVTEFVCDADRFADLPDDSLGARFPLALNAPGPVPLVRVTAMTPPTWMVCYGHRHDVATIYVDRFAYASGSAAFPWTVHYLYDALGTPYTAVIFGAGTGTWEDTTSVYATLALRDDADELDVVGVAAHLASRWSLLGPDGLSGPSLTRAASKMGATIGLPAVYINGSSSQDATRALQYVEQTLCASYPMLSMAWQVGGYGPVVTDRRARAVAKYVVGQGILQKRTTDWQESDVTELYNSVTIRYGYRPLTDDFRGVVTRDATSSLICQVSEELVGPRVMDPLDSTLIQDASGAEWVADWIVAHMALPSYLVEHDASPQFLLLHSLGDCIDVVDPEITGCDWDHPVRATVDGITYRRGSCTVKLRLWPLLPKLLAARAATTTIA